MNSQPERLRLLADRLTDQSKRKKRRPPGTNLLDEDISVSPHEFPGILTQTMGGPERKKEFRQAPMIEGPRGIASSEKTTRNSTMKTSTKSRIIRVARLLRIFKKVAAGLDLRELAAKVAKINAAIQSGKLPPEKMQQAAQMLAQLTMQMAQAVSAAQGQRAASPQRRVAGTFNDFPELQEAHSKIRQILLSQGADVQMDLKPKGELLYVMKLPTQLEGMKKQNTLTNQMIIDWMSQMKPQLQQLAGPEVNLEFHNKSGTPVVELVPKRALNQ